MPRWYLVRHGETAWNAEQRVQGQIDVPLHDPGRAQVAKTAERLAGLKVGAVYTSDLSRAKESAELLRGSLVGEPPLHIREALREIDFGVLDGMTWPQINEADPTTSERQHTYDLDWAPDRGETFRMLLRRVEAFADELREAHAGEDALVVAHGGSLRALAVALLGLPDEAMWRVRGLKPASISIIMQERGHTALTAWNDAGHLSP